MLWVGGGLWSSCYRGEGGEHEVDSVECAVAEDAVVALGSGVEEAVEAGDSRLEDFDGKAGVLEGGEGVDVVVLVAETAALALDVESGEAGEVGCGGACSDDGEEATA